LSIDFIWFLKIPSFMYLQFDLDRKDCCYFIAITALAGPASGMILVDLNPTAFAQVLKSAKV
jgi:hypothetical protein